MVLLIPTLYLLIALAALVYVIATFGVAFRPTLVFSAQGQCQITDARLLTTTYPSRRSVTRRVTMYRMQFTYTLTSSSGQVLRNLHGYDWFDDIIDTNKLPMNEDQRIMSQYQVGHTYLCWYNTGNPSWSVLRLQPDWERYNYNYSTDLFNVAFGLAGTLLFPTLVPIGIVILFIRLGIQRQAKWQGQR